MKLNSKVTGGLAWAGLVLVLAVPSAEMLTKPSANSATITSDMDAMETASAAPAVKPVVPAARPVVPVARQDASGGDAVEEYISSGKKLPSYISDAPSAVSVPATVKPAVVPAAPTTTAVQPDGTFAGDAALAVASANPTVAAVAPVPYPASMRPGPSPAATAALAVGDAPLIVDENALARREAALRPVEPIASAGSPDIVTQDQLEEWDSGSLADYLERKGLLSGATERLDSQFDEDGFFLGDGPNDSTVKRRRVYNDADFFLF